MKELKTDIGIIGAGPAGIACSVQLKRFGIEHTIFEKESIGGMLKNANWIENYPGYPAGINGIEVCELLKQHADQFHLNIYFDEILSADYDAGKFHLTSENYSVECKRLVIASGTKPKPVTGVEIFPEANEYIYRDIYNLRNIKNKEIGIVGAGDAAFDYALTLAGENKIHLYNKGEQIKAIPPLVKKVQENDNIECHSNTSILTVEKLKKRLQFQTIEDIFQLDYLIFAIGRLPLKDFLSPNILLHQNKLVADDKLFLIGDVANENRRQLAIAAGNGIECAMRINELEHGSY
ncbi:MAG: NAD(P)/FAD-dependent oxidoreductase [Bacteroidales bacterium]|nr:NAD(P)/FAD-dependent oxidoreductase [Bacteroidales bacterium]MCF8388829.1 NAD(P)/FAD-dependent oxidoreductase [Bacteroidales bacterium]MCF8398387.1 NAD(P)/FAD-dependent oxidoreductase [Bacteroidales bacterium]